VKSLERGGRRSNKHDFLGYIYIIVNLDFHIPMLLTSRLYKSEVKFRKFETRLKYGWFHLKVMYSIFQDLSRRSIETSVWRI